jgi:UDP-3-O-[3-hydroxymyristoyl] glucosamine N-acyltransferase
MSCTGGRLVNLDDLESCQIDWERIQVERPASLGASKPSELAFFFSRAFEHELGSANPGILIIGEDFVAPLKGASLPFWTTSAVIACQDPYLALAQLSGLFAESLSTVTYAPSQSEGLAPADVHPTALVDASVELGVGVKIGAYCIVEKGSRIGTGTVLYPGCYVGPRCLIGESTVLFPRVTLYEWTQIGDRVRIHAGSVLGSDGFGYAPLLSESSPRQVFGHQKIYHLGRVVLENDVEVGANTCIDRGTFGDTQIGKFSKLDNLVHIGHNSRLDEGAVICGGSCLAGNASVGKYAYVGGLTGIGNHVHVGDGAKVGALTMVTKDVVPGGTVVGNPQRDSKEHFRAHALLSKLLGERRSK